MEDRADSFAAKTIQQELKSSDMDINIAEKEATAELDQQDFVSTPKKENLGPGQAEGTADAKAEAKLAQDDDDDALFEDLLVAGDLLDTDHDYLDCEAAEDADDEISSDDDDYKEILPSNIKKAKTGKEVNQENRDIHQTVPDHRVKLTQDGWKQAEEAGQKLRSLLRASDTLHFFTSPYRRTRETTEGILNALTSPAPDRKPSPFPRHTIKVYEEPRLREQDFGNFQPDSAEMSKMWQERADYGHFFYRIPNGESAADAYDRVSGFNESLWRSFGESDFASICVLVTHGLMTRVFLMKWYHFSVEYFEDLRNMNHCEFVVMKLNDNGKYVLQNQLRTWSELKRERANSKSSITEPESPIPVRKRWGGCLQSDGDRGDDFARRQMARRRKDTKELFEDLEMAHGSNGTDGVKKADDENGGYARSSENRSEALEETLTATDARNIRLVLPGARTRTVSPHRIEILKGGRDGGGSRSGAASPSPSNPEDSEAEAKEHMKSLPLRRSLAMALNGELDGDGERARADALGDQSDVEDEEEEELRKEMLEMEAKDKGFQGAVT